MLGQMRAILGRLSGRNERRLVAIIEEREAAILEREKANRDREQTIDKLNAEIDSIVIESDRKIKELKARNEHVKRLEAVYPISTRAKNYPYDRKSLSCERDALDYFDAEAEIRKWKEISSGIDSSTLRGAQRVISPYIVERRPCGQLTRILIATEEGQCWYDNLQFTEAHAALSFGAIATGDTIIDCGCNQGVMALIYSSLVGPSGRVIGFDPFPMNIMLSRFNAELNRRKNIEFVQAGLSDKEGVATVSTIEQCVVLQDKAAPDLLRTTLYPLDKFAENRPGYVKIDIEGAEVNALEGATDIIAQRPIFYIEVHPNFLPLFNRKPMDIFKFIDLNDYRCHINYPGKPELLPYEMEFEITDHCGMFFVPRSRPAIRRYYLP